MDAFSVITKTLLQQFLCTQNQEGLNLTTMQNRLKINKLKGPLMIPTEWAEFKSLLSQQNSVSLYKNNFSSHADNLHTTMPSLLPLPYHC